MRNHIYESFELLPAHAVLKLYHCPHTKHLYLLKRRMKRLDPSRGPRQNPMIAHYSGYWIANPGTQLTIDDAIVAQSPPKGSTL